MNKQGERICGFRVRNVGSAITIDEKARYLILEVPRVLFGLCFVFPFCLIAGAVLLKDGLLGVRLDPNGYSQYSIGSWLIIAPFLCVPVIFAYIGLFVAFARIHVEARSGCIRRGYAWFGSPVRLKATPVPEVTAIQLNWERRGMFGGSWYCVISIVCAGKPVELLACCEKEGALKLGDAIAQVTKLPVRDTAKSGP